MFMIRICVAVETDFDSESQDCATWPFIFSLATSFALVGLFTIPKQEFGCTSLARGEMSIAFRATLEFYLAGLALLWVNIWCALFYF